MSASNGVIRVGRKGLKKFAFGDDGEPFEVDVVMAFQEWVGIDESFREHTEDRVIPNSEMPEYHMQAVSFVKRLAGGDRAFETRFPLTTAEALDFIARLRECYDEVAAFFRPKSREERDSPDTSGAELRFSVEGS